ncbi:permease of the major facilitator superfamily protein [Ignisphaera aggregans DSM 17230]|uniref:Permease of the major facilitator superfamily protein n=1 Tax=Ignisphaera aggregans (strain DSM 17230 / JCM 13409 / AQ1.S1) TaxID=583356 RepID=E0SSK4_IGNAA|nr:permease of the major facilitator superfamily protein [Ignisphaera aggregans DSM 17230]
MSTLSSEEIFKDTWIKRWIFHSIFYNFSVIIASVFYQAYAIRVLNYSIDELGTLTFINIAMIALGNFIGLPILYRYRNVRVLIWKFFTSMNLISWSLTGFVDVLKIRSLLYGLVAIAQFSGAVGGLAYSDTIADIIPKEKSLGIFSKVNTYVTASSFIALTTSTLIFWLLGSNISSYRICYTMALTAAIISIIFLSILWEKNIRNSIKQKMRDIITSYLKIVNDDGMRGYIIFFLILTVFTNIPAAIWNYYILKIFNGSETWISINNISSTLATVLGNYTFSRIYHRLKPRNVLIYSIIPISFIPIFFLLSPTVIHQALLNFYSGFSWAAFNLVAGIYNLYLPKESDRIYLLSLLGIVNNLAAASASKLGAYIASINILLMQLIFIVSGVGRLLAFIYGRKRLPSL